MLMSNQVFAKDVSPHITRFFQKLLPLDIITGNWHSPSMWSSINKSIYSPFLGFLENKTAQVSIPIDKTEGNVFALNPSNA